MINTRARWSSSIAALVSVVVALAVLMLTFASQLPGFSRAVAALTGGDFLVVALLGLLGIGVCLTSAALAARSPDKRICRIAALVCVSPVVLLAYYLSVSEG